MRQAGWLMPGLLGIDLLMITGLLHHLLKEL